MRVLLCFVIMASLPSVVRSQQAFVECLSCTLGVYDSPDLDCNFGTWDLNESITKTLYVGIKYGQGFDGLSGIEFSVQGLPQLPLPHTIIARDGGIIIGQNISTGINVVWQSCLPENIVLLEIRMISFTPLPNDIAIRILQRMPPLDARAPYPLFTQCDFPIFTKTRVTGGCYVLNPSVGPGESVGDPPCRLCPFGENGAPVADAGADVNTECAGGSTAVTLDASLSSDPDGDTLTFLWSAPGIAFDEPGSETPTGQFPLGTTEVTLTVRDEFGAEDTDTVNVGVTDTTPPVITLDLNRDVLWPPNRLLSQIVADLDVRDVCDAEPTFVLISITSDEPSDDDIDGANIGSADLEYMLRAERDPSEDGRTYTIVYTATDASHNSASAMATVRVPHDKSAVALAANGFQPDGEALVPRARTFLLVLPARQPATEEGGKLPDLASIPMEIGAIDLRHAYVGNHLSALRPQGSRRLDVDADGLQDLVLEYDASSVLILQAASAASRVRVGLHFVDPAQVDRVVPDIFALGDRVLVPTGSSGPRDEIAGTPGNTSPTALAAPFRTGLTRIEPNPFNPATTVHFQVASDQWARIAVYSPNGQLVRTLAWEQLPAGDHHVAWDGLDSAGRPAASGVYFFRLITAGHDETRKGILMK